MKAPHGLMLLLTAMLGLSGCAAGPVDDPMVVMLDRSRDPVRRLAAAERLGPITATADPKSVADTLHNVLWSDGEPTDLRLLAMDRLVEYDADAFWLTAQRRIREVDNWDVLNPIIDRMVEQGDPAFTATLIRSYVRPSQVIADDDRPERRAIEALNPEIDLEQAIWGGCITSDADVKLPVRVDAWTLTVRLSGIERARQLLNRTRSDTLLIQDLKAADRLGVVPVNREGVLWLMYLRSLDGGNYWLRVETFVHEVPHGSQRKGLELRHLPALVLINESTLSKDKQAMLSHVQQRLSDAETTQRTTAGIARKLPGEALSDHTKRLCWMDLLIIDRLLTGLQDRALVDELFRQADADHADTSTEHGGVLTMRDDRLVALPFMPDLRLHDRKFYSSEALVERMYTGLLHYHFHAQQYDNADYAGPGVGDLEFAERLRPSAVVFTFLDHDTLGVDYYQAGGVVVDLGVIRR